MRVQRSSGYSSFNYNSTRSCTNTTLRYTQATNSSNQTLYLKGQELKIDITSSEKVERAAMASSTGTAMEIAQLTFNLGEKLNNSFKNRKKYKDKIMSIQRTHLHKLPFEQSKIGKCLLLSSGLRSVCFNLNSEIRTERQTIGSNQVQSRGIRIKWHRHFDFSVGTLLATCGVNNFGVKVCLPKKGFWRVK